MNNESVQLIEIGQSGKNFCLTLDKAALNKIKEGATAPIEFQLNGKMVKIVVMRDSTFIRNKAMLNKLSEQAKQSVQMEAEINKELSGLGEGQSKIITP